MVFSIVAYIPGEKKLYRGTSTSLHFLEIKRRAEIIILPGILSLDIPGTPDIVDILNTFDEFRRVVGIENFKFELVESEKFLPHPYISLGNLCFCIAHRGLTFYKPAKRSLSPEDSNAFYLAEDQSKGIILQFLFSKSHTSDHSHPKEEIFYTLTGKCFCLLGDEKTEILLDNTKEALVVPPNQRHQVKTTSDTYALNLILLEGGLSKKEECRYYRAI